MLNIVNVLEISSRFHYMRPDDRDKTMKIPTDSHSEVCFFTAVWPEAKTDSTEQKDDPQINRKVHSISNVGKKPQTNQFILPCTTPQGYWRAFTILLPTETSSVLPTTANGKWPYKKQVTLL